MNLIIIAFYSLSYKKKLEKPSIGKDDQAMPEKLPARPKIK